MICDEYTGLANKEQLSFCIRWVDNLFNSYEEFLGFYEIPNIKSYTIIKAIKDILIRFELELDNCRGQKYDGASNMLGHKSGVGKQFHTLQPKSPASHCQAHCLAISVKYMTNSNRLLSNTMGTTSEIIVRVKYSPKREQILGTLKDQVIFNENEDSDERVLGISKLAVTRWTIRASCYQRILDNYKYLFELWEICLHNGGTDSDIKARIIGCKKQMQQFDYLFGLHLGNRIYSHTDKLWKALQNKQLSASSGKHLASLTIEVFKRMRNDDHYNLFFESVLVKAKQIKFIDNPQLPRET